MELFGTGGKDLNPSAFKSFGLNVAWRLSLPRNVLLLARELGAGGSERQLAETAKALHRNG